MAGVVFLALAASVPIAVSFLLLVGVRWSASKSMGVGWVLASVLGLAYWQMEPTWWIAAAIYGMLQASSIILIVFGAVLLMNYLELSGAITTIRWYFRGIEEDRRVQLLLIGLGFETIIEGAAGFGTPGALAAPLFIGLGFPPLGAAVFGLFFNAPNPQFGAAGTPIIGGVGAVIGDTLPASQSLGSFLDLVSAWSGVMTGLTFVFWGLLGVFLLTYWFGDEAERSLRGAARATAEIGPFATVLGMSAGLTQWAVAWFIGPALPSIAAGFVAFAVGIVLADRDILIPDDRWAFPDRSHWSDQWLGGLNLGEINQTEPKKQMPVLLAWTPYLLVGGVLLVTRWPTFDLVPVLQQFTVGVSSILGTELSWELAYLYLPGTMPFIPVAVLTGLLHRMDTGEMVDAWGESIRQVVPAALTLVVAVSLTQVMIQSATNSAGFIGMMTALSQALAMGAGAALPIVSPWIGALGTFVTGSNTTSDILFSVLQYDAAVDVSISPTLTVAIQNVGGGIGNMISVLNVAAICGVVGISGREGDIMRKTVVPTVIFALFVGLVGTLLIYFVGSVA
jgi:lactate permease